MMLAVLQQHERLQSRISRTLLSPTTEIEEQNHALLPFLPVNPPPWYLAALPPFGLSRLSYMLGDSADEASGPEETIGGPDGRHYLPIDGTADVKSIFAEFFAGEDGVKLRADFGHHLFIDPFAAQARIAVDAPLQLLRRTDRALSTFLPA